MVGLFSTASKDSQIGVDFLRNGVAVAQVVFQGSHFDLFQLQRDKDADWRVDFEIATSGSFTE